MKYSAILIILLLMLAPAQARGAEATPAGASYSIQVRAVPLAEAEDGMTTYRQLQDRGYLVHAYRVEIDGAAWLRIGVGAFQSRGAAAEFGLAFGAAEGMDHFVTTAPVLILPGAGERDFVVTPSGLWVRGGDGAREVLAFDAEAPNGAWLPVGILPEPSPGGDAIVFLYNYGVYTATLDGAAALDLTEPDGPGVSGDGEVLWRPGWSPSGEYVAFLDQAFWEHSTGLWLARADGGGLRCLAPCEERGNNAVRWFVWHPSEDRVLFVEGFGFGLMVKGGGLFSADMDGTIRPVAAVERGEREEIVGPLRIEDGLLHFRRLRWLDEQYDQNAITDESIPVDAL